MVHIKATGKDDLLSFRERALIAWACCEHLVEADEVQVDCFNCIDLYWSSPKSDDVCYTSR